ncbi:MAG TPA: amino acid adenylation domain-containing protein, partial [Isosphaeraceae bacterium]|nr:amino acid adenylation domain-containing protein [Isosphaeraceae bacterium]
VEFPLRALFEAPTVAALADRIEVARREGRRRFVAPIVPVPRDGELPLSFAQQALWFLDRLTPQAPTFNVPAAVRITGPLDVPALERSFHEILRRHEALRTAFPAADGRPVPVIAPSLAPPLTPVDLSTLDEAERTECARRLAVEESRRPFDLAAGPLIRAQVLRLDDQEHVILLTMHHIITDGWSMGVAARELAALYEAYTTGSASPLAELPIQYADYAAWQRAYLQGEVLAGLLAYWSERLAGLNPLELPTDRPRPAVRSGRGDVRFFDLSPELAAGLRDLSRREGATLFMTLLAGFQALLSRYSGQDDIAVGVPVANRNRPEVEDLIGYFVNMLVLRTDLSDDPTFGALVQRVRETTLGAFEHQELPFDQLVQALQPVRDPSRTPLFDVMFVLQNNRMPDASRQELTLGHLEVGEGTRTAKFDLTLCIVEGDERLFGSIEYNTDLFDGSTIERLIGHFRTLLATVVAQPGRRVSEAALLDEAERLRLVEEWNQTAADLPEEGCLHRLVEAQARRTPEAVALVHNGRTWSYRELNARANRLARWLRSRGVGPEVRVGLFLDRSVEAALGLLGILKAGGAYVPFEPSAPERRLAGMLEDADVALVLTRTSLRDRLPARRAEVLCLDSDRERFGREPDHDLEGGAGPENAAYVIFTSGSTGPPRGVIVSHRSVVNHCIASARMFALGPGDRVLQFAPLNFDIAVEEIFPAWCTGSAVVLRDGDELLDPTRFTDWIERERITVVDLPTGYWHAWVDRLAQLGRSPAGSLRLVVVGGEKAIPAAYATWRRLAGDRIRWLNTYGPTEATVIATAYEPPAGAEDLAELPIGRPIANARVYVLDGWLQPVPIGLPGELCIGGLGVSRGYRDHAAQTAERFLPDPFTTEPGARLFRTGDLVRWRPDGQLVFVGRVDFQAKIRGFRVEPGEVEAALLEQPGVRAAKVVARAGVEGSARLDAYLVLEPGATAAPGAYRSRLRDRLPGHMVPSSFTALEALPLTPSGKVDLRALPDPGRGAVGSEGFVAPRDEVEARLAAIWEDLLAIRPVGVTDSFFDLGGHSLLAIRMLTRVEAAFGRALPLSSVFLGAAIADLAEMLRRPVEPRAATPLVALQPAGASRPFFCVHPAGGIAYCFLELAQSLGADRPFYAFQAPGLEGDAEPFDSLERMAAHYIDAMRTVQPAGPYHLGGWSLGGLVAYEMARQLTAQGQPVATLAVLDAHAPSPPPEPTPALRRLAEQAVSLPLFRDSLAFGDGDAGVDDVALLLGFLAPMAPGVGLGSRRLFDRLNRLSPDEQRLEALKFFGLDQVYHRETEPERVARLWKVLGTNLLAALKYTPRPYPGRLVLLRAAANSDADADPAMGWGELAAAVATHTIPGDHAAILRPPGVAILAGALIAEIARCEASWDGRHGRIQPLR